MSAIITDASTGLVRPKLIDGPPGLGAHLNRLGPLPPATDDLIDVLDQCRLGGRGGAGFPVGRKLAEVARRRGRKAVVANGTEGEPLSVKDKTLLARSPHLVLDGLHLTASVLGASRRILCLERDQPALHQAVEAALAERGDHVTEILPTPSRYITGQETALVDLVNHGPGKPTHTRPFERGVDGRPTLVSNVETLAQVALIARWGARRYASQGVADQPGTTLTTIAGAVRHPGVYEVPFGTPLRALLLRAGAARPRAVLIGGYFGTWIPYRALERMTLDRRSLGAWGASLGSGVIAVIDDSSCAVAELARVATWFASASAGQCGACTWGLRDLAGAANGLHAGGSDHPAEDISRWTEMLRGRGACRLPDGAVSFLRSGMTAFGAEIADHQHHACARQDRHLLRTTTQEPWT